jgi:hypothetical protein
MVAELFALHSETQEVLWLRKVLGELRLGSMEPTVIFCNTTSTISNAYDPNHCDKTKHINLKYFLVREHVHAGNVKVEYVESKSQIADIFTKALDKNDFSRLWPLLGLV